jgi:hypothetical protein
MAESRWVRFKEVAAQGAEKAVAPSEARSERQEAERFGAPRSRGGLSTRPTPCAQHSSVVCVAHAKG